MTEPKWVTRFLNSIDPKWAATIMMGMIGLLATRWEAGNHIQKVESQSEARDDSSRTEIRRLKFKVLNLERRLDNIRPEKKATKKPIAQNKPGFFHRLLHPFGG